MILIYSVLYVEIEWYSNLICTLHTSKQQLVALTHSMTHLTVCARWPLVHVDLGHNCGGLALGVSLGWFASDTVSQWTTRQLIRDESSYSHESWSMLIHEWFMIHDTLLTADWAVGGSRNLQHRPKHPDAFCEFCRWGRCDLSMPCCEDGRAAEVLPECLVCSWWYGI